MKKLRKADKRKLLSFLLAVVAVMGITAVSLIAFAEEYPYNNSELIYLDNGYGSEYTKAVKSLTGDVLVIGEVLSKSVANNGEVTFTTQYKKPDGILWYKESGASFTLKYINDSVSKKCTSTQRGSDYSWRLKISSNGKGTVTTWGFLGYLS